MALLVWHLDRDDGGNSGRSRLLAMEREIIRGYPEVRLTGFRGSVVRLSLPHTKGWGRRGSGWQCSKGGQVIKRRWIRGVLQGINATVFRADSDVLEGNIQRHWIIWVGVSVWIFGSGDLVPRLGWVSKYRRRDEDGSVATELGERVFRELYAFEF
jgi:hypothetical protein